MATVWNRGSFDESMKTAKLSVEQKRMQDKRGLELSDPRYESLPLIAFHSTRSHLVFVLL